MESFLIRSAIDRRFVDLVFLMCIGVWPWLVVISFGIALIWWRFVVILQFIALPFAVIGWAAGFRYGRRIGFTRRGSAMLAGWAGLLTAEAGLALMLWPWLGQKSYMAGLLAFPALAVLVTVGVLVLYREETWKDDTPR